MKLIKFVPAIIALTCTANAYAGFFGSSDDFKCGREDAVKALSDSFRSDASGLLQSDYLTKSKYNYEKPVADYQNKLNGLVIGVSNVSTSGDGSYGLNCSATISVKVPQETLDVVSSDPNYLHFVTGTYGKLKNGNVVWSDVSYSAKLADNGKDVIFSHFNRTDLSDALFNISVLSVNKDQIINAHSKDTLNSAKAEYKNSDRELNSVWRELPDSSRNALKKEQLAWVNGKVAKCGKLSDAESNSVDMKHRIEIYQCQTKMTNERIDFLSGNN
ncbi:lysozyme inhibitor LprI family protein [Klebsiella aerogenes]